MLYQASKPLPSSIILVVYERERCFNWFVVRKRKRGKCAQKAQKLIATALVVTVDVVVYNNRKSLNTSHWDPSALASAALLVSGHFLENSSLLRALIRKQLTFATFVGTGVGIAVYSVL